MDLTQTIEVDSTQVNADDLVTPHVVTITGVSKGTADQPVNFELAEFPDKVYRPCKSMRRVLVHAWGTDAKTYVGRRMEIFNDPSVKWGGVAVGGVRISRLSHIDKKLTIPLTVTRGQRKPYTVEPLNEPPPITQADVTEFEQRITTAGSVHELDVIAGDLKARDLGSHRGHLQTAWSERRKIVSADVVADDGQLPMGATDEGE